MNIFKNCTKTENTLNLNCCPTFKIDFFWGVQTMNSHKSDCRLFSPPSLLLFSRLSARVKKGNLITLPPPAFSLLHFSSCENWVPSQVHALNTKQQRNRVGGKKRKIRRLTWLQKKRELGSGGEWGSKGFIYLFLPTPLSHICEM